MVYILCDVGCIKFDDLLWGRYGSGKELGGLAEWLKALVLKTSDGATRSWVRIPPSPPLNFKTFK